MKKLAFLLGLLAIHLPCIAQFTMHDFNVTDSQGGSHALYADYLGQGKTVVIKFFFSTCPPCNAVAPSVQQLYVSWGEGQGDVEFFELSTQPWDNSSNVNNYKATHGLTMPSVGADGGSRTAAMPFLTGAYGPFYGTPSFAVVESDGTLHYPVNGVAEIDDLLDQIINGNTGPQSSTVSVQMTNAKNGAPINVPGLQVTLRPMSGGTPVIDLMDATNGTLTFEYPSANFPEINNPVIEFSSNATDFGTNVTPIDLVTLQRHILLITPMDEPRQLIAGDVNGDNRISGQDVVAINKIILQKENNFPNGTPSYKFEPAIVPLSVTPGNPVQLSTTVIKMGDVSKN